MVAGAVTAAHDPPTRAADASRLSARCHQLSSKPARAIFSERRTDFRRFKRRRERTGPRPDDEYGPRIRFEFHDWAFVCIGSTGTTLRPDFRAPVARRVVGLRSQFRVEALVWPLSEGIRTRHCHLRHRVSPTEPGDRCESASLWRFTRGRRQCARLGAVLNLAWLGLAGGGGRGVARRRVKLL